MTLQVIDTDAGIEQSGRTDRTPICHWEQGVAIIMPTESDARQRITDFVEGFHRAIVEGEEDLSTLVDRFHTLDMITVADGYVMDRDKLLAHVQVVRRRRPCLRLEILEAFAHEDRVAARYLMHITETRCDDTKEFSIEVHEFAQFAGDGRLCRANSLTRTLRDARPLTE